MMVAFIKKLGLAFVALVALSFAPTACQAESAEAALIAEYHNKMLAGCFEDVPECFNAPIPSEFLKCILEYILERLRQDPFFPAEGVEVDMLLDSVPIDRGQDLLDAVMTQLREQRSPVTAAIVQIYDSMDTSPPNSLEEMLAKVNAAVETKKDGAMADVFSQVAKASEMYWTEYYGLRLRHLAFWKRLLRVLVADAAGAVLGTVVGGPAGGVAIGAAVSTAVGGDP